MTRPGLLLTLAALALAACADEPPAERVEEVGAEMGLAAPTWSMTGPGGTFSLADASGRAVVLQFGPSEAGVWTALRDAHLDLEAAGALVVGAVTNGSPTSLQLPFAAVSDSGGVVAETYGYTGQPLVVVIDADGRLRSRAEAVRTTDQFFDLAAGALLDAEVDAPMSAASESREPILVSPEDVDALVREGAALVDLRPEGALEREGAIPFALVCPVEDFAPEVLPMNALVPVILAGPDALSLASDAMEWGYREVYVVEDASALADPEADALSLPEPQPPASRLPGRRRAIG